MPVELSIGGTLSSVGMSISQRAVQWNPSGNKKVFVRTTGRSLSLSSAPRVFHVFPGGELLSSAQEGSVEVIRDLSQPLQFYIQTCRDCRRWGRLFTHALVHVGNCVASMGRVRKRDERRQVWVYPEAREPDCGAEGRVCRETRLLKGLMTAGSWVLGALSCPSFLA